MWEHMGLQDIQICGGLARWTSDSHPQFPRFVILEILAFERFSLVLLPSPARTIRPHRYREHGNAVEKLFYLEGGEDGTGPPETQIVILAVCRPIVSHANFEIIRTNTCLAS